MNKLDVTGILNLLEEIVAEAGEDTTRECYYRESAKVYATGEDDFDGEEKPHCIAGVVIYKLGGLEALERLNEDAAIGPVRCDLSTEFVKVVDWDATGYVSFEESLANGRIAQEYMTDNAIRVLILAQEVQDRDKSWGRALEVAKTEAVEHGLI